MTLPKTTDTTMLGAITAYSKARIVDLENASDRLHLSEEKQ